MAPWPRSAHRKAGQGKTLHACPLAGGFLHFGRMGGKHCSQDFSCCLKLRFDSQCELCLRCRRGDSNLLRSVVKAPTKKSLLVFKWIQSFKIEATKTVSRHRDSTASIGPESASIRPETNPKTFPEGFVESETADSPVWLFLNIGALNMRSKLGCELYSTHHPPSHFFNICKI